MKRAPSRRLRESRGQVTDWPTPTLVTSVTGEPDASEEVELHPQYDMAAQLDALYSVPVYRYPENPHIESWRELGERLLALGERHLLEGVDAAGDFLETKLEARRRRRERRAAKRRAEREARAARAPQAPIHAEAQATEPPIQAGSREG